MKGTRGKITTFLRPNVAGALCQMADALGMSQSEVGVMLIHWGAYALINEATMQGKALPLDGLKEALQVMPEWGPLVPSSTPINEDLRAIVKKVISQMRADGEL